MYLFQSNLLILPLNILRLVNMPWYVVLFDPLKEKKNRGLSYVKDVMKIRFDVDSNHSDKSNAQKTPHQIKDLEQ